MTYQIYYEYRGEEGVCCINTSKTDLKDIMQEGKDLLISNKKLDCTIFKVISLDEDLNETTIYENKNFKYKRKGFENREDYLLYLSGTYNIPLDFVITLATTLGENEDFDGLIGACIDAEYILNTEEEN